MPLVDDRRCSFEAAPDFLAFFLGHGSCLAILLMEFLQLMEGTNHIWLVGEFLGLFTQMSLFL